MKFLTYGYQEKQCVGILSKDESAVIPVSEYGFIVKDMNDFIDMLSDDKMKELQELFIQKKVESISFSKITKMAVIPNPKQDIICLGINYMAHAEESARYKNEDFGGERPYPIYFSKRVNEAIGDGGEIDGHFDIVDSLDYEVELAVIIGKDAKNVSKENAFDYVLGYTIVNDVSARNVQTAHKQWYFGKSLDGFTPIGPYIVTKDEFFNPPNLKIISRVNGEIRQNSTTDLLIFDIAHIISELSLGMTLKAGTIIATGTPAGVGMGFVPPNFLKVCDVVECEIEGIGKISNTIV